MPPSIATCEQIIALIVGAGLRPRSVLEPHSSLAGDLGFDEIDCELVAIACEDFFLVSIPEGEPTSWKTIADIARSVDAQISAHAFSARSIRAVAA